VRWGHNDTITHDLVRICGNAIKLLPQSPWKPRLTCDCCCLDYVIACDDIITIDVRLRMQQLQSDWTGFHEIWYGCYAIAVRSETVCRMYGIYGYKNERLPAIVSAPLSRMRTFLAAKLPLLYHVPAHLIATRSTVFGFFLKYF
jgi:hypothetical protein